MSWQTEYNSKKVLLEKALSFVKSGDRVVVGHACGEPVGLVEELVRQKDRLINVEIVHMVAVGKCEYCHPGMEKHFRHNSLFVAASSRQAVNERRADFTPVFFSEIPRLFKEDILPVDVALIQVSEPDEEGNCSYGVSVDYTKPAAECAKIVVAEVNKQMPRTYGSCINVSDISYLVETETPILQIPKPKITEVEKKIGEHIASLIPDRANLQLGIGSMPDAVLQFLKGKKDLGIHSEMFSDGVADLFNAGVVTNKYNNLNPGKFVSCFLMGTQQLYDFVDNNPDVLMKPVDYTNNIMNAGRVDNLISINACVQVDLFGQVCSDTIGYRQFSAVGGQVDFVRASSVSPGGKSIIAMASTAKNESVSKIVVNLDEGACVTTSRNDVHFIVTEYGIADLRGKSLSQRASELIKIAHPKFRETITKTALEKGLKVKTTFN
jgi:4-hydroxybutyrate CoA-transferase